MNDRNLKILEVDPDYQEPCEYCESYCPAKGYWRCPKCDAEWHDDDNEDGAYSK